MTYSNTPVQIHAAAAVGSSSKNWTDLSKEVWIGWISSLVEAYNMAIYSFIAPLLAPLMFQKATEGKALLFSYLLAFLGFGLFYPLGALYYGSIGDKKGRQKTCVYSTLGLAIATGMMGLFSFHFFGDSAWIYFLACICAQYFFSGGEYYGSIVFSLEHAEGKQTGLMSALSCLFAVFGLAAANGLASLSSVMQDMLWLRICFLMGLVGGLLSYILKKSCRETRAFMEIPQNTLKEFNWGQFIRAQWRRIMHVAMFFAFFIVSYSFIFIFLPLMPFEQSTGNFDTFQSLIAYGIFLVVSGWMADRFGTEKVMTTGLLLFALLVIPLCYFCNQLFILQMLLTLCACLVIGPIHGWALRQFTPSQRCRGIFISSAIAFAFFGGSTVPICLYIYEVSNSLAICAVYPFLIALLAFNTIRTMNLRAIQSP